MSPDFEEIGRETPFRGRLVEVQVRRIRHADGEVVIREVVHQQGAVAIVAHDGEHVWLVRQPREAVAESELLELPAGRLDVEGEQPLAAAQRELAEEIGRGARHWESILSYHSSPGTSDEQVHLYAATGLYLASADSEEVERIEIVPWPLHSLGQAIDECRDAKTLIGLLWLSRRLSDQSLG